MFRGIFSPRTDTLTQDSTWYDAREHLIGAQSDILRVIQLIVVGITMTVEASIETNIQKRDLDLAITALPMFHIIFFLLANAFELPPKFNASRIWALVEAFLDFFATIILIMSFFILITYPPVGKGNSTGVVTVIAIALLAIHGFMNIWVWKKTKINRSSTAAAYTSGPNSSERISYAAQGVAAAAIVASTICERGDEEELVEDNPEVSTKSLSTHDAGTEETNAE